MAWVIFGVNVGSPVNGVLGGAEDRRFVTDFRDLTMDTSDFRDEPLFVVWAVDGGVSMLVSCADAADEGVVITDPPSVAFDCGTVDCSDGRDDVKGVFASNGIEDESGGDIECHGIDEDSCGCEIFLAPSGRTAGAEHLRSHASRLFFSCAFESVFFFDDFGFGAGLNFFSFVTRQSGE